jgi:hypothetical protein
MRNVNTEKAKSARNVHTIRSDFSEHISRVTHPHLDSEPL